MEWLLSGLRQDADQLANKERAKLCWAQNALVAGFRARGGGDGGGGVGQGQQRTKG